MGILTRMISNVITLAPAISFYIYHMFPKTKITGTSYLMIDMRVVSGDASCIITLFFFFLTFCFHSFFIFFIIVC